MEYKIIEASNHLHYMQHFGIHSLLAKVFAYKQLDDQTVESFLKPKFIYHDFSLLEESADALERMEEAIENKEKVCIYGDYDCDGILATTILVQAFHQRGLEVGYYIPDRTSDGYGLTSYRVSQMADKGYSLIITVDNGVKAFDAVEMANECGIDVIISDHHGFETDLPDAFCVLHTKLSPNYPFKEISGGFLAYKIACALLKKHDKYLYSLASITAISDMMLMFDENRTLVKQGLVFMKENKYPALEALKGEKQEYSVQTLGFTIAPKINSFGRLCELVSPNKLIPFFKLDASKELIDSISQKAIEINSKRQTLTNSQYKQILDETNENFLFSYEKEIHPGIIGLVAGKYTRDYYRPSFVMHYDSGKKIYKGSARGIKEAPLTIIFDDVKDYLEGYGGHQLAGGFSVTKENLEPLKQAIQASIHKLCPTMPVANKEILQIEKEDLTIQAIKQLEALQPTGQGNMEVLFAIKDVSISNVYSLSGGKHCKIAFEVNGQIANALYFNVGAKFDEIMNLKHANLIGTLQINEYLSKESINMILEDIN